MPEYVSSVLLITVIVLLIYFIFKAKIDTETNKVNRYTIEYLCEDLKKLINSIVNMDIDALNLNKKDLDNRRALKRSLSDAIRKCSQGNMSEKMIVYSRIKNTLAGPLGISEEIIDKIIPFYDSSILTPTDKFEILMYLQKRAGSHEMFRDICKVVELDRLKQDEQGYFYDITTEDINEAYDKLASPLSYDDKLNILTQRIYEETYGLSVVDLMIMEDDSLDSVSGGISGVTMDNFRYKEDDAFIGEFNKPRTYESVWVIFGGKPIHIKFLSFKTSAELIRICKNLSEHGRMGHITSSEGGIKTHLADGSRVTIFRPNNGSQWAFFVRKFGSAPSELKDLITDEGNKYPIGVIQWATKGCLNLFFTGDQNSGKTTNTRAAVKLIDRRQQVRTIEADFELYLNDYYYDKNILGTRPSERLDFPKLIELIKSTNAHTVLFGETASLEHAKHLINLLLAGTKRIITTGHWPTSDEMVSYFVHSMGGYGNSGTNDVEAMIARLLHLDVHCVKENDGHRHIDRITEIIPYSRIEKAPDKGVGIEGQLDVIAHYLDKLTRNKTYYTRDIVIYEDGVYKMVNPISDELSKVIMRNLPPDERYAFLEFNTVPEGVVN
jgi:pilus assembly protein CpaF